MHSCLAVMAVVCFSVKSSLFACTSAAFGGCSFVQSFSEWRALMLVRKLASCISNCISKESLLTWHSSVISGKHVCLSGWCQRGVVAHPPFTPRFGRSCQPRCPLRARPPFSGGAVAATPRRHRPHPRLSPHPSPATRTQ